MAWSNRSSSARRASSSSLSCSSSYLRCSSSSWRSRSSSNLCSSSCPTKSNRTDQRNSTFITFVPRHQFKIKNTSNTDIRMPIAQIGITHCKDISETQVRIRQGMNRVEAHQSILSTWCYKWKHDKRYYESLSFSKEYTVRERGQDRTLFWISRIVSTL